MGDGSVDRPVGGKPAFVAAHGIVAASDLTFDEAYGLARMVLELRGPVPVSRKRSAQLPHAVIRRLTEKGFVEQLGQSQLTEWIEVQMVRNLAAGSHGDYSAVRRGRGADERTQWFAVPTEAGSALVYGAMPEENTSATSPAEPPADASTRSDGARGPQADLLARSSPVDVAAALRSTPATKARDVTRAVCPNGPGLYAWWCEPGLVPDLAHAPDGPTVSKDGRLELLYVGLTTGTLRQRIVGNHLGNRTGSSTLRRALGAWLGEAEGWQREWRSGRQQHSSTSEAELTRWMRENLYLTWVRHPNPSDVEADVIRLLLPPLNYVHNSAHPNYSELRRRREAWRTGGSVG
ncbi:GIY-YIG nuclease family protein [Georgenia thermotolerans]|uniref:GIY-YIG catalytic domain-containing protein n=1 Tax=Georgenia thermotolerans TaxID=527326 RepID=A0A7J5UV41_9MICO|nr:hypothetical protein [Georgenia thermotolerans]KAE8766142.1 hypothetical protein GB883_00455 [Georgenia thermotolerans]